ncbi:MAG TPA: prenyltransferase/squalene oxidase repeat-containing protein [Planctomycetota bacterium]|nr:prenyltransferase/squalene oxidase repeat-containing protein [Planctomycetota bacterium]
MRAFASFLLISLLPAFAAGAGTEGDGRAAAKKAAAFLWSKQDPDGAWRSQTYGLLRSGQSLTPFVLLALLGAPDAPRDAVDRAVSFIRASTDQDGQVGRSDPSLEDYPNFATSLAVRALESAGKKDGVDRLRAALKRQQFSEQNGWLPDSAPYGAWGMGGPLRKPPYPGHVDLSMTRHVLQALGGAPDDRASTYLRRCQNGDGGFMFSTVVLDANKAGVGKSYGTATADAILSLLALSVKPADPSLASAVAWLSRNHRSDVVPGFDDSGEKWRTGMLYYYLAASAQAFHQTGGGPAGWRSDLLRSLAARQRSDGSFKNASFLMKEDDPLLATTFALLAFESAAP